MSTSPWNLYVDESGSSYDPNDLLVVVGIALNDPESPASTARLRRELERVYPVCPWPPHASSLNINASRLAAHLLVPEAPGETAQARLLRGLVREPCRRAQSSSDSSLDGFQRAIQQGRFPAFDQLQACDAWLSMHFPGIWHKLSHFRAAEDRRMRALLSMLARTFAPDKLLLLVSASKVADARPVERQMGSTCVKRDPYVCLAEGLFERLFCLRCAGGASVESVWARLATRNIEIHGFPKPVGLYPIYVGDIVKGAMDFPMDPAARSSVRVIPLGPLNRYDSTAHPLLVVADYLANRLRKFLLRAPSLEGLERCPALGLPGQSRIPLKAVPRAAPSLGALPTIAGGGKARELVRQAFELRASPACDGITPTWARQQAEAWCRVAHEGGWV